MGRSLSHLSSSLPERVPPDFSSRKAFISGISFRGDSIIPPAGTVSGKALMMYGAKRASRAEASAMSAVVISPGSLLSRQGFSQKTSFPFLMSSISGNCCARSSMDTCSLPVFPRFLLSGCFSSSGRAGNTVVETHPGKYPLNAGNRLQGAIQKTDGNSKLKKIP